jgi:hypothetical protein
VDESCVSLRRLLAQRGSYPVIAAAVASGRLPDFSVKLFEHVGDVYRRVETAAGDGFDEIEGLRLAALAHEEPPESLRTLFGLADISDLVPIVAAVTGGFGRVWKVRTEGELDDYVELHRAHLASILLFEVAHEGRATPEMERAAEVGGIEATFKVWAERLAALTPPNPGSRRMALRAVAEPPNRVHGMSR